MRVKDANQQPNDLAGGEELTRLLARFVREVFQQVFITLAKKVMTDFVRIQCQTVEGVDEIDQRGLREPFLITPRRVTENPSEAVRVCLLDLTQRLVDRRTQVRCLRRYIAPVRPRGKVELVVISLHLRGNVIAIVSNGLSPLPVIRVRDPLPKEDGEHIGLEVSWIHRPTQSIRRIP